MKANFVFRFAATVAFMLSFNSGQAQNLDENCFVSVLNRSSRVNSDGTWRIDNLPANFGAVRVRATCVKNGVTASGQSDLVNIEANIVNGFSPFSLGSTSQIPSRLALTASSPTLTSQGTTAQVTVTATYPNGASENVTAAATGTSYTSSNPATATVSPEGLVTAVASGTVLVSAINEGAVGVVRLRVMFSGMDSDGDGIPDDIEVANGMNPNDPVDAQEDPDHDGLTNFEEVITFGSNRLLADTDNDGISDGDEAHGTLGFVTNPLLADTDGDGINDLLEIQTGSNPNNASSYNLAAALLSIEATPVSFVITINTIIGEGSRQLLVTGHLRDGNTINLTSTTRGTNYTSSNLQVASFGSPDGRVFGGQNGTATITVTNSGFTAPLVSVTVRTSSPAALSFVSIPGFANSVAVSGNYAYVAAGATGLQVVNVANRTAPSVVAALDTPGNANDIRIVGNLAYVADGSSGLRIISVANPLAPVFVGTVDTPGTATDLVVVGNRCYIADGSAGLQIVDVSVPTAPLIIGHLSTLGPAKGVDVFGAIAVVAEGSAGVQVINVSDSTAPVLLGARSTGGDARDVAIQGNYAFVADYVKSLTVIDFTDPRNPILRASTPSNTGGLLQSVALDGRFALGADVFFVNGIPIIDIQNPASPIPRTILNFSSFRDDNGTGIAVDGSYVYMTAERGLGTENGVTGDTRLYIGQYLAIDDTLGIPPNVSIAAPPGGATLVQGETLTVAVNADDDVGVASVTLNANGVLVGSDTVAPYEFSYTVPNGISTLTFSAVAVDFGGNTRTSAPVNVNVIPDPGTIVVGRVRNETNLLLGGATVSVFNSITSTTAADGSFSIPGVPTIRGSIQVSATIVVDGVTLRGTSLAFAPVAGGTVNVGDIVVRPVQNQGREFIVAFELNNNASGQTLSLFISGDEQTQGIVEIPALAFSQNFSVTPGSVTTVVVPATAMVTGSDIVVNRGIHVTSERPVSLYGLNRIQFTTDGFAALPVETFGTRYRPMCYSGSAEFAIVAASDGTTVTITPSVSGGGHAVGVPFQVSLNRFEVYQLIGADFTGSLVNSDKPIGVFSGHPCANVPPTASACDHLCEQIPPTATWGQAVLTVPLATRFNGDTFRILADQDNTSVTITGPVSSTVTLQAGKFREVILTGNNVISATKPILVAQYSNGSTYDGVTSDPFMMLIPPAEQFLRGYTFTTPASGFSINYMNIVALQQDASTGRVLLDNLAIPSNSFSAIGTTGFSSAQRPIALGSHSVSAPNPLGIYIYGFASFDSYGYPGGFALTTSLALTSAFEQALAALKKSAVSPVGELPPSCAISISPDLFNAPGTAGSFGQGTAWQVNFRTTQGNVYRVERSENLETWAALTDNIVGTGQPMAVAVPSQAANLAKCFYRVVTITP